MSSDIAIRVENLGKMYRIGREHTRAAGVARLRQIAASPFRWLMDQVRGPYEDEILWALRNVSFEVKRGEVVGIIGRNGAGKSTLLKILSRITEPSEGKAAMHGRVGSLLEVGTGMHPELTGRENIFLNGCILGMRKSEITDKFDEIVDFSGIAKFIDTPVKRYSSGMRVRLGFSIAAHLEPEILLVDEVLAVGDAAFQKKCLGKMEDVAGKGRTVLFVSHNMAAVSSLCPRAILLSNGKAIEDDSSAAAIEKYYESLSVGNTRQTPDANAAILFHAARILNKDGCPTKSVDIGDPFVIEMEYRICRPLSSGPVPNFHFYTTGGVCCFVTSSSGTAPQHPGLYQSRCHVPGHLLNEGTFSVGLAVTRFGKHQPCVDFFENGLLMVTVRDPKIPDEYNHGYVRSVPGIMRPKLNWEVLRVE
jgi:lipopolysaccharide transport system ATP-binding protein